MAQDGPEARQHPSLVGPASAAVARSACSFRYHRSAFSDMTTSQKLGGISHLFYFTSLQLIVYADRSLLSGLLLEVQKTFSLNDTQGGYLGSAFMGGFMVMSPFVAMARGGKAVTMTIGISLVIWMLAEAATCFATSNEVLVFSRVVAGAGEAGFCALAPPMIDDTAPPLKRSRFVAIYYSGVFVGMAIGFMVSTLFPTWETGRFAFLMLAIAMAPYCIFILLFGNKFHVSCTDSTSNRDITQASEGSQREDPLDQSLRSGSALAGGEPLPSANQVQSCGIRSEVQHIKTVLESGMYDFLVLGFSASQFVIGGLAYWALTYLQDYLGFSKVAAGIVVGLMTVATGIGGSTAGGILFDRLTEHAKTRWNRVGGVRGVVGCCLRTVLAMFVVPSAIGTGLIQNGVAFVFGLGITQVFAFMGTAPLMVATMESVPSEFRGIAMGMCTLSSHLLGDLFSPTLVGKVADATGSLRVGLICLSLWSAWCPIMWGVAYCLSLRRLGPVIASDGLVKST